MGRWCRRISCSTQSPLIKAILIDLSTVDGDNKLVNFEKLIDLELDFTDYELENLTQFVIFLQVITTLTD